MSNHIILRSRGSSPHAASPNTTQRVGSYEGGEAGLPPLQNAVFTRLLHDAGVDWAFIYVHQYGPGPAAQLLCELLDAVSADPAVLDRALDWLDLDPDGVQLQKGYYFHKPPLDPVTNDNAARGGQ